MFSSRRIVITGACYLLQILLLIGIMLPNFAFGSCQKAEEWFNEAKNVTKISWKIDCLQKATAECPQNALYHLLLAYVLTADGRIDKALEELHMAQRLDGECMSNATAVSQLLQNREDGPRLVKNIGDFFRKELGSTGTSSRNMTSQESGSTNPKNRDIRGWLGISMRALSDLRREHSSDGFFGLPPIDGLLISEVGSGSPADASGLKAGKDIIVSVNGSPVANLVELTTIMASMPPGANVELGIYRLNKGLRTVNVTLGKRPNQTSEGSVRTNEIQQQSDSCDKAMDLLRAGLNSEYTDEKTEFLVQAARFCPQNAAMQYAAGQQLFRVGQYMDAITGYRNCLELDPTVVNAHFGLATAYRAIAQYDSSLQYYNSYISLISDLPDMKSRIAETRAIIEQVRGERMDWQESSERYSLAVSEYLQAVDTTSLAPEKSASPTMTRIRAIIFAASGLLEYYGTAHDKKGAEFAAKSIKLLYAAAWTESYSPGVSKYDPRLRAVIEWLSLIPEFKEINFPMFPTDRSKNEIEEDIDDYSSGYESAENLPSGLDRSSTPLAESSGNSEVNLTGIWKIVATDFYRTPPLPMHAMMPTVITWRVVIQQEGDVYRIVKSDSEIYGDSGTGSTFRIKRRGERTIEMYGDIDPETLIIESVSVITFDEWGNRGTGYSRTVGLEGPNKTKYTGGWNSVEYIRIK